MKLQGIRVLDLSRFLPGPMLTQLMADHGAEVIKIESVDEGEPTRDIGEKRDGVAVFFANSNRGKKSLALNLKQAEGVEVLMRLAETADVMVEAFRPGVAERLGIGYREISARAPHIVYASISAFGQTGPYRNIATHDLATEAMAGVLSINCGQDRKPAIPGMPASDMLSATMGLSGVLMALLRRRESGQGDYLDIAMAECLLACVPNNMGSAMASRRQPAVGEERSLGGNALYSVYETKDDRWIALGSQEHKFAVNLLTALGRPDLIATCELAPGAAQQPVRDFLDKTFRTRTKAEWIDWFSGRDIPFAPVKTLPEVLEDPHFRQRGMVATDARGWDHIGNPIRFEDEPGVCDFALPAHGQHSSALLRELGYTEEAVGKFVNAGIIKDATHEAISRHSDTSQPA